MPKVIADMQIFQAVMEIIAERGYAGATTRQIAEAAGVSEVTLFRKYGSKAELVKRTISALVEQTEFESATQYTGDIRADLLRVLQAYQEAVILTRALFLCPVRRTQPHPRTGRFILPTAGIVPVHRAVACRATRPRVCSSLKTLCTASHPCLGR